MLFTSNRTMASSIKRSALSLNNEKRQERSGSTTSNRTTATHASVVSGTASDFWNRLSQQMSYIDGSTHSSSIIDGHLRGVLTPRLGDNHLDQTNKNSSQQSDLEDSHGSVACNLTPNMMASMLPTRPAIVRHNSLSENLKTENIDHRQVLYSQNAQTFDSWQNCVGCSSNSTIDDHSSKELTSSDSPLAIRGRSVSCNPAPSNGNHDDLLCFEEHIRCSFPGGVHHQSCSARSSYELELEIWRRAVNRNQNSYYDKGRVQPGVHNTFLSARDCENGDDDDAATDDDDIDDIDNYFHCIVDDEREDDGGETGGPGGKEDLEMGLLQPMPGRPGKTPAKSGHEFGERLSMSRRNRDRSGTIPMSASALIVTSSKNWKRRNLSKERQPPYHSYFRSQVPSGNVSGMFFDNSTSTSYGGTFETSRKKASSWEESATVQRRQSLMLAASLEQFSANLPPGVLLRPIASDIDLLHKTDLRYYFQHPYPRLFVTYFVIFCNFLLFAEDPISHSHTESDIPMVGNVFSFVVTKYTPEWRWTVIKILMWILAMLCGMIFGKLVIHGYLFGRLLRLKMFRDDQGSWMTMFMTVIVSLYVFSHVYNLMLYFWYPNQEYQITSQMGVTNASVMKAAACGTWLGDLITALMVTDMMLQDNLYPNWATWFRRIWRKSNVPRILIFWVGSVFATSVVVTLIVSDWISWDKLNKDFISTNEISRAFLASFILVMDLLIVMQDWDFPNFTTTLHVNLPGMNVATLKWKYAEVNITGKWFNYGIIFLVMMLDLNMWKNQIFYNPSDYGQYTGPDDKVRTVNEGDVATAKNTSQWTWESRSMQFNVTTGRFAYEDDLMMNSRYMGYPLTAKWTAFIPSVFGLMMLVTLVTLYGRFPSNQSHPRDRPVAQCRDISGKQQELLYCEKKTDQVA